MMRLHLEVQYKVNDNVLVLPSLAGRKRHQYHDLVMAKVVMLMMVMMMMRMLMLMMMMMGNLNMLHSPLAIINSDKSRTLCIVDIVLKLRVNLVLRSRHLSPLRPLQPHPQADHIAHISDFSLSRHHILHFSLITYPGRSTQEG